MRVAIELTEAQADELRTRAKRLGLAPEELASAYAIAKAGALGFSLIQNHAFVDGNERAARRG
jgi:hypothetical protein